MATTPTRNPPGPMSAAMLRTLAAERITDAETLFANQRYDGAVYIVGYAVEYLLKARICDVLNWATYQTAKDFQSFKTHDYQVLLQLAGRHILNQLGTAFAVDWTLILQLWSSQNRYEAPGTMLQGDADAMIQAVKRLETQL